MQDVSYDGADMIHVWQWFIDYFKKFLEKAILIPPTSFKYTNKKMYDTQFKDSWGRKHICLTMWSTIVITIKNINRWCSALNDMSPEISTSGSKKDSHCMGFFLLCENS
jgi:hypothetical protein